MMPSYLPHVEVDGARATLTVRNVEGELVEITVDTWSARKLALALGENLT
ncbi:hypothetical protein [Tomitella biformata]|nr:hypothetical protein [Tomitella biformata]